MRKLLSITLLVFSALFLVSCQDNKLEKVDNEVVFYTYTNDNSIETLFNVKDGSKIEKPEDPIREGYEFIAWSTVFRSTDESNFWDFDTNVVEKSTILYAIWELVGSYSITYHLNGGEFRENVVVAEEYNADDVVRFATPTRRGYTFAGWFTKPIEELTSSDYRLNNTTGLFRHLDIYAKWDPLKILVSFNADPDKVTNVKNPANRIILFGSILDLPVLDDVDGYKFIGWRDGNNVMYNNGDVFDRGSNVTLRAVWEEV